MKATRILKATLALILILATPGLSRAGGFTQTTFGGRRVGMHANLGNPDDLTALFHNPAGLAAQPGIRVHVSGSMAFTQQSFQLQALDQERFPEIYKNCQSGDWSSSTCDWPVGADGYYRDPIEPEKAIGGLPYLGVSTDLDFLGPAGRDVVVSFALTAPLFMGAYLPEDAPTAYNLIGGYFLVLSATAGVAWQAHPKIAIGGSISYNHMRISLAQKMSLVDALTPKGATPDMTATMARNALGDIRMDYEGVDHGVGWALGILAQPIKGFRIGLAYSGAMQAYFEGPVSFSGTKESAKNDPSILKSAMVLAQYKLPRELGVELPIPHNIQGGINVQLSPHLEAGFDVRFWLYNLIETQALRPIYDESEPGKKPLTEESLSRDKDFNLSYQVGGGLMFRPFGHDDSVQIMFGVGYDHSPTPPKSFTLDNAATTHTKISLGLRWRMFQRWRMSATYFVNLGQPMDIKVSQTNPPTNVRGAGISHSPGLEVEYVYD